MPLRGRIPEFRGLRRKAVAIAVLGVLGPLAVWLPLRRALDDYNISHARDPIAVPAGESVRFAGAEWELVDLDVDHAVVDEFGDPVDLPDDTTAVIAHVAMTPDDERAIENLVVCPAQVRDRGDRIWLAEPVELLSRQLELPTTCGGDFDNEPRPGRPFEIEFAFLVPEDVAEEVELDVIVSERLPRYLRFQR